MWSSIIIITTTFLALTTSVTATPWWWPWDPLPEPLPFVYSGGQCCQDGLDHCQLDNEAWGCVQLEGPNCVDQTKECDEQCSDNGFIYAYQKNHEPFDRTCVCSNDDASQPLEVWDAVWDEDEGGDGDYITIC